MAVRFRPKSATSPHPPADSLIPLTSRRCLDSPRVGGKAAKLASLLRAGFPVPEGFVVPAEDFRIFCRRNGLEDRLWRLAPREAAQAVMGAGMPASMQARIAAAARQLGTGPLAVRSSALAEDRADRSMAGQFDTFLHVAADEVPDRVRACWASLFHAAPHAYRLRMDSGEDGRMGVIVQRQIAARYAGVVFTIDPVSRSADDFVVEWVQGLGDRLVSGQVTPQRRHVRRDRLRAPDDVPPEVADSITRVCRWARRAEQHFRQPIDMEWAADARDVFVLQARPVTALTTGRTVVWTNVNLAENFPQPLTPLAWSLVQRFYGAYMQAILRYFGWRRRDLDRAGEVLDHLTGLQLGRIYYRLNNWYAVLGFFPCSRWLIRFLDHYIGQKIPFHYIAEEKHRRAVSPGRRLRVMITFWPRLLRLMLVTGRRMAAFEGLFFRRRKAWRGEGLTGRQLIMRLRQWQRFVARHWQLPAMADVMVMILPGLLEVLTRRWLGEDGDSAATQLYRGIDLISLQPSVLIWELARSIHDRPSLAGLLRAGRYAELEEGLPDLARRKAADFMERFGGRCYHDCMVVAPTFMERRDLLWKLVADYMEADIENPAAGLAEQRRQYRRHLSRRLSRLAPWRRWIYRGVVRGARQSVALRERGRLLQSLLFGEWRLLVMALGRHLQAGGAIGAVEDVFYLHQDELEDLLAGRLPQEGTMLAQKIEARRKAVAAFAEQDPPSFFFLEPGQKARFGPSPTAGPNPDNLLTGTGVSRGRATAAARVILDPLMDNGLRRGEILVTRATDPGWTPLFSIAGGLVLERGGLLSHGAIVAREFGIPAVVGVVNATRCLADGCLVTVDGDEGTVKTEGAAP